MFEGKSIGVIVPAYNEERLISKTLTTMPDFVDRIIVINDASRDRTAEIIREHKAKDSRIVLIDHEKNQGLGQSLVDGYLLARDFELDVVAVMAGDGQMSPKDLPAVVGPIAREQADYVKGNRLLRSDVFERMPRHRYFGNNVLTLLTKFATGYWHIIDPQCGYTAISKVALKYIPIQRMTKGYGYNADILNMLNISNFKVLDVEVEPVYGEETSKIRLQTYIPKVSWLLVRLFIKRIRQKYLLRDFNPLAMFYFLTFVNLVVIALPLTIRFFLLYFRLGIVPTTTLTILNFSIMMGLLSFFFGMWMDMEDNRKLRA